jgi:hypothetical protein
MKNTKNINSLNDNSSYLLYNVNNFNPSIANSVQEILKKFVSVIVEYMRFISEKITMKNKPYYRFIFERGLETIIHIFLIVFYYTKNLDLTFYHTQKAYYFYIEFIEQISDDNITFLQLSSRDAILFVYKKTIYEINNDYRKNITEPNIQEKNILSIVDSYTDIYRNIIKFLINHKNFTYENKMEYINSCCDLIVFISDSLNKNKIKKNLIDCISLFTTIITNKQLNVDVKVFFTLLDEFIKKLTTKKKLDEKAITVKLYDFNANLDINNSDVNKIIQFIFLD